MTSNYDNYGRKTGYGIDNVSQAVYTYDGTNGRLIGMNTNGANFGFGYMENTHLQNTLTYPNGMVKTTAYEPNRSLISSIENKNGNTQVSKYAYDNDILGRRTELNLTYQNNTKNFDYGYNTRSEVTLTNQEGNANYQYGFNYDNIGNRVSANENGTSKTYTTNNLNQYTSNSGFTPTYDLDGNAMKIKTSTGEWNIEYNGENRPVKFTSGNKRIEMSYDYMGRRVWLAYWINNAVDKERRFMYKDYTLVQEMKWDNSVLKEYIWDPTTGKATKPLVFKYLPKNYTLFYTHDGNKNVSDLVYYATANGIGAHYEYSPFGGMVVSSSNSRVTDVNIRMENPFRFSSEYHDDELGLIYYNYRHYNSMDGKWINRDPVAEFGGYNLYGFIHNNSIRYMDALGLTSIPPPTVSPRDCRVMKTHNEGCPPFLVIAVGGAMDETNNGPVKKWLSEYYNEYFNWTETTKIADYINCIKKCCSETQVILAGHSYGGASAYDALSMLNDPIEYFITLDPVSYFNILGGTPNGVGIWINIYQNQTVLDIIVATIPGIGALITSPFSLIGNFGLLGGGMSLDDFIATMGGQWGNENGAVINIGVDAHHANAMAMYLKALQALGLELGKSDKRNSSVFENACRAKIGH